MEASQQATYIVPSEFSSYISSASPSPELLHSMSQVSPGYVIGPYVALTDPAIGKLHGNSYLEVSTTATGAPAYNPLLSVVQSVQKGDMPSNMQIQEVISRTQGALLGVKYGGSLTERG